MRPYALLVLAAAAAATSAQVPANPAEQALAVTAHDASLKWGPCPEFMPKGCGLAVLHGDPAGPNADVFLKVPAGAQIARHWHSSAERMILVAGELTVAYDGQKPVTLKPGMYAYGPAKAPHEASCARAAACVLFIAFESPVDAVKVDGEAR